MKNSVKSSFLVMPTHYIELDCEEMAYVTGGEVISLSQLNSDKTSWLALGTSWAAAAVVASAAGGVALTIPFVGAILAAVCFAEAAAATVLSGLYFSSYSNACTAISTIQYYQSIGRSYTINRYVSGGVYTYIVE